jgi:uncharacterized GH25 family protein
MLRSHPANAGSNATSTSPPTADPEIAVSNVAKIALPLLLLAAIGGGAAYYLTQSQPDAPPVPSQPAPTPAPKEPEPTAPATPEVAVVPQQDPIRIQANNTIGSTHADAKQGVRGRVLLPTGAPAQGLPVLLLESAQNDPLKIFLQNKMGKVHLPLAAGETDATGGFQLGVLQPGKGVDLRILSPDHPELQHANIKVQDGDWFDAGDLRLEVGLVVTGRIVEVTTKAPVPNATVFMQSSHQSHAMVATPGRERGIVATTDAGGSFQFTNAPRMGLINLVAEAQGFASTQLLNQTLRAEGANDFTIEVELGLPIAGHTVDGDGKPLGNITVTANGLSAKTPQIATAVSDSDGMFSFASLRTGPYLLTATSAQHAETKLQPVMTGDLEVKLVMPARGSVKLRVLAQNGRAPLKSYRLGLKRFFENNPLGIANVPEFPDKNINPGDYPSEFNGQWALIKGLPSGHYRFQITENNHAKTLSPPFQVEEGAPPVEVVCELTLGGIIIGTVIDDRGKPVQGATVNSDMNAGLAADTQIFEIFASMIPEKHTKSSTTTDAQGRFRLPKLAFADYMIRVAHPQYCEGKAINLKLETEGQVHDVGVIQLALGTVIEGVAMVEGVPTGQITVTLSTPAPTGADALPTAAQQAQSPEAQQQAARALFSAKAISDGDGRFRLLKRVPPGTYKVTASRSGGDSPFFALIDMRESERQITVQPGTESLPLEFNLSRR